MASTVGNQLKNVFLSKGRELKNFVHGSSIKYRNNPLNSATSLNQKTYKKPLVISESLNKIKSIHKADALNELKIRVDELFGINDGNIVGNGNLVDVGRLDETQHLVSLKMILKLFLTECSGRGESEMAHTIYNLQGLFLTHYEKALDDILKCGKLSEESKPQTIKLIDDVDNLIRLLLFVIIETKHLSDNKSADIFQTNGIAVDKHQLQDKVTAMAGKMLKSALIMKTKLIKVSGATDGNPYEIGHKRLLGEVMARKSSEGTSTSVGASTLNQIAVSEAYDTFALMAVHGCESLLVASGFAALIAVTSLATNAMIPQYSSLSKLNLKLDKNDGICRLLEIKALCQAKIHALHGKISKEANLERLKWVHLFDDCYNVEMNTLMKQRNVPGITNSFIRSKATSSVILANKLLGLPENNTPVKEAVDKALKFGELCFWFGITAKGENPATLDKLSILGTIDVEIEIDEAIIMKQRRYANACNVKLANIQSNGVIPIDYTGLKNIDIISTTSSDKLMKTFISLTDDPLKINELSSEHDVINEVIELLPTQLFILSDILKSKVMKDGGITRIQRNKIRDKQNHSSADKFILFITEDNGHLNLDKLEDAFIQQIIDELELDNLDGFSQLSANIKFKLAQLCFKVLLKKAGFDKNIDGGDKKRNGVLRFMHTSLSGEILRRNNNEVRNSERSKSERNFLWQYYVTNNNDTCKAILSVQTPQDAIYVINQELALRTKSEVSAILVIFILGLEKNTNLSKQDKQYIWEKFTAQEDNLNNPHSRLSRLNGDRRSNIMIDFTAQYGRYFYKSTVAANAQLNLFGVDLEHQPPALRKFESSELKNTEYMLFDEINAGLHKKGNPILQTHTYNYAMELLKFGSDFINGFAEIESAEYTKKEELRKLFRDFAMELPTIRTTITYNDSVDYNHEYQSDSSVEFKSFLNDEFQLDSSASFKSCLNEDTDPIQLIYTKYEVVFNALVITDKYAAKLWLLLKLDDGKYTNDIKVNYPVEYQPKSKPKANDNIEILGYDPFRNDITMVLENVKYSLYSKIEYTPTQPKTQGFEQLHKFIQQQTNTENKRVNDSFISNDLHYEESKSNDSIVSENIFQIDIFNNKFKIERDNDFLDFKIDKKLLSKVNVIVDKKSRQIKLRDKDFFVLGIDDELLQQLYGIKLNLAFDNNLEYWKLLSGLLIRQRQTSLSEEENEDLNGILAEFMGVDPRSYIAKIIKKQLKIEINGAQISIRFGEIVWNYDNEEEYKEIQRFFEIDQPRKVEYNKDDLIKIQLAIKMMHKFVEKNNIDDFEFMEFSALTNILGISLQQLYMLCVYDHKLGLDVYGSSVYFGIGESAIYDISNHNELAQCQIDLKNELNKMLHPIIVSSGINNLIQTSELACYAKNETVNYARYYRDYLQPEKTNHGYLPKALVNMVTISKEFETFIPVKDANDNITEDSRIQLDLMATKAAELSKQVLESFCQVNNVKVVVNNDIDAFMHMANTLINSKHFDKISILVLTIIASLDPREETRDHKLRNLAALVDAIFTDKTSALAKEFKEISILKEFLTVVASTVILALIYSAGILATFLAKGLVVPIIAAGASISIADLAAFSVGFTVMMSTTSFRVWTTLQKNFVLNAALKISPPEIQKQTKRVVSQAINPNSKFLNSIVIDSSYIESIKCPVRLISSDNPEQTISYMTVNEEFVDTPISTFVEEISKVNYQVKSINHKPTLGDFARPETKILVYNWQLYIKTGFSPKVIKIDLAKLPMQFPTGERKLLQNNEHSAQYYAQWMWKHNEIFLIEKHGVYPIITSKKQAELEIALKDKRLNIGATQIINELFYKLEQFPAETLLVLKLPKPAGYLGGIISKFKSEEVINEFELMDKFMLEVKIIFANSIDKNHAGWLDNRIRSEINDDEFWVTNFPKNAFMFRAFFIHQMAYAIRDGTLLGKLRQTRQYSRAEMYSSFLKLTIAASAGYATVDPLIINSGVVGYSLDGFVAPIGVPIGIGADKVVLNRTAEYVKAIQNYQKLFIETLKKITIKIDKENPQKCITYLRAKLQALVDDQTQDVANHKFYTGVLHGFTRGANEHEVSIDINENEVIELTVIEANSLMVILTTILGIDTRQAYIQRNEAKFIGSILV